MMSSIENTSLANKISKLLGNPKPKPAQIKLIENLLFKSSIQHKLFFHENLTLGEKSCLLLAATGNTIQQSAELLGVKYSTVMTLRKRVLEKLKCQSMAQAVFMGIHYGYCFPSYSIQR